MSEAPFRVAVVLTHPIQYFSPWFRYIAANVPEIRLEVLYAVRPTARAQAVGFGGTFSWSSNLFDGYSHRFLRETPSDESLSGDRFSAVDAPQLDQVLPALIPDAVLLPGWHAAVYRRASRICRRLGVPLVYRGDSTLQSGRQGLMRPLWRLHSRRRLREFDAFLSVGARASDYLRAMHAPEPMTFSSPHAVDNQLFAAAAQVDRSSLRARLGLDPALFTLAFVGKLDPEKRLGDAIAALERVEGAQLLVAGSGDGEAACRREAARRGVRVQFAGFVNQADLPAIYAAADCLVVPSQRETWGLVVNEAMAAGIPVVVSDGVGCAPDLISEDETGAMYPVGQVAALAAAIDRVRQRRADGHDFAAACRARIERYDFAAASAGLLAACRRLAQRARNVRDNRGRPRHVLACCGHMVVAGGLERMTFEIIATLRRHDTGVHCLVNRWSSSRIVLLAETAGASWSVGTHYAALARRPKSVKAFTDMIADVVRSSADVVAAALRERSTHVLAPDFHVPVRCFPAFVLLRLLGRRITLRVGVTPGQGRFYAALWKWLVNPAVDHIVCNSDFFRQEVLRCGVPAHKVSVIRNTPTDRGALPDPAVTPYRVIYVGQTIPDKGVDLLIRAVGILRRHGVPATLDVVGQMEGWEAPGYAGHRASLRDLVAREQLSNAVRFLGYREDAPALMRSAAVHCLPSRLEIREGMSNAVLEAKAAGLPSVTTRSGALPELIEHRVDGWLADATPEGIAEGLRYFLEDEDRRRSAGIAAQASLVRFSRDAFESAWLREFDVRPVEIPAGVAAQGSELS